MGGLLLIQLVLSKPGWLGLGWGWTDGGGNMGTEKTTDPYQQSGSVLS